MQSPIDELYARWQKNPDAARTAALCDALRASPRLDLVEIVGSFAAAQKDVSALVAAGRMYTEAGRLDDAQSVLVAAGQLAPRDGEVFRWLGEVLLRRGDAERAERVLERAVQFAGTDPEAGAWLARARKLITTQRASGMPAVAASFTEAKQATQANSPRPAPISVSTRIGGFPADEPDTLVRMDQPRSAPLAMALGAAKPAPSTQGLGLVAEAVLARGGPPPALDAPASSDADDLAFPASVRGVVASSSAGWNVGVAAAVSAPDGIEPSASLVDTLEAKAAGPTSLPEARDVLDALELVGVFEPERALTPTASLWDKPERGRLRIKSIAALAGLAIVAVAAGVGTLHYVKDLRAKDHVRAEAMLTEVDKNLLGSETARLDASEALLSRAFELDSRSPRAALAWLRERAARGLLMGGEDIAFQDAIMRAKDVGVGEPDIAFAYVASFLFQADTAGALNAVAKWDEIGRGDAWFQIVSGATLERAGDEGAASRYEAAVKLAPELFAAKMFLIRSIAASGAPEHALERTAKFRAEYPHRPEAAALVALAWSRDPSRGEPSADVISASKNVDALPLPLKTVPFATEALIAMAAPSAERGSDAEAANRALERALGFTDTPGLATWLGELALDVGNESLASRSALRALSMSPAFAPARVLAAHVALAGGHLDEAVKAAEELAPASVDVAIVKATAAYEKVDVSRLADALDALPPDAKAAPAILVLARGRALLGGDLGSAQPRVSADAPWSDLVAMDAALDTNDLDVATKTAARWSHPDPFQAARLSRLARYKGRLDDADRYSRAAFEGGTVTLRSLTERVFTLVALEKTHDALTLLRATPAVGGTVAKWLRAYVVAAGGKAEEARASVAQEDPPSDAAALPYRVICAMAYGAMKDARHGKPYVEALTQAGVRSLDVQAAAESLGAKVSKASSRKRR